MIRKIVIVTVILLGALSTSIAKKKTPNILYIMSDDHTTQAFGIYGSRLAPLNPTPTLDQLGKEGIIFDKVYCNNAICTPSRASILSGQYPQTNGVLDLHQWLPVEKQHLPQEMKKLGYETAVIGKWHLKVAPESFDHYEVLPLQGKYFDPIFHSRDGKELTKVNFGKYGKHEVKVNKYKGHSSDVITDLSIEWLDKKRDKSKPFLLMHHFKAPHDNFEFAPRYKDYLADTYIPEPASMYHNGNNGSIATRGKNDELIHDIGSSVGNRNTIRGMGRTLGLDPTDPNHKHKAYQEYLKRYLRCVKGVDDNVKRLIDYLKKEGLYENTIIVYTADQGFMLGEHDYIDKRWMYEESMRMPFIVHYPKGFAKGLRSDAIINNTDFAPTLIEVAGGVVPDYMQGNSFKSQLAKGETPDDWQQSTYYRYWMHMGSRHANPAHFGIRNDRYKLILFYGRYYKLDTPSDKWGRYDFDTPPAWEFYDLQRDPEEMQNEYANPKYADIIQKMKSELKAKRAELNEEDTNYPHLQAVIEKHWND
ncbi:sulfatase family protein [Reichenbachiella versicolor]|uniref:sulfatase family protein n=1 Tax=Reichenbachiella versicolor TaxID=1821036 RepID=UPI000D6DC948|nr:sulfatase [Reichenbachiella versicolor]